MQKNDGINYASLSGSSGSRFVHCQQWGDFGGWGEAGAGNAQRAADQSYSTAAQWGFEPAGATSVTADSALRCTIGFNNGGVNINEVRVRSVSGEGSGQLMRTSLNVRASNAPPWQPATVDHTESDTVVFQASPEPSAAFISVEVITKPVYSRARLFGIVEIEIFGNPVGQPEPGASQEDMDIPGNDEDPDSLLPADITARTAVGITLINQGLAPVEPVSEEQIDDIDASVNATLAAMPPAQVDALVQAVNAAAFAIEDDLLKPTDDQISGIVMLAVSRVAPGLYRPPGYRTYYEDVEVFGMTKEERRTCALDYWDCWRTRNAYTDARTQTIRRYGGSGRNNPSDAFRHCDWSALMTKRANANFAFKMGNAHEAAGNRQGQERREFEMDTHNNLKGRDVGRLGGRDTTLADRCQTLQYQAELVWIYPY